MPLTTPELEAQIGRFMWTMIPTLTTPNQLDRLARMMRLLIPAGARYFTTGTLGTQAERQEAMASLREAAWVQLHGGDPSSDPELLHFLTEHWEAGEE